LLKDVGAVVEEAACVITNMILDRRGVTGRRKVAPRLLPVNNHNVRRALKSNVPAFFASNLSPPSLG